MGPTAQGRLGEPLPQLPGGVPAEGAQHDVAGSGLSREQRVQGPQFHAEGLARPGTGYGQQGALRVSNDRSLVGVQLRVQTQYGG